MHTQAISVKNGGKDLYIPIEFDITKPKIFDDVITKITSKTKERYSYII
jgi:hypothetical protein